MARRAGRAHRVMVAGLATFVAGSPGCSQPAPPAIDAAVLPAVRSMIGEAAPVMVTAHGFELGGDAARASAGAWRVSESVRATLAADGGLAFAVGGATVRARRLGPVMRARLRGRVVHTPSADGTEALLFARGTEVEELVVLERPSEITYDVELPPGWTARRAGATGGRQVVQLADASGEAQLRVRADRGWDAHGEPVEVGLELEGRQLRVTAKDGGHAYPLTIDPTWSVATAPIRIRQHHTATLLGDGTVLVAGGGTAADSTEIWDPRRAHFGAGPTMGAVRVRHTATRLLSGKVLVAGGGTASAELYDPEARSFAATGAMSVPRAGHSAARLRNGKVLLVAGATPPSAEVYDPETGTFTPVAAPRVTGNGPLVVLASGRVLHLGDAGEVFDPTAGAGQGRWTPMALNPPPAEVGRTATLLHDGTVLVVATARCGSVGGPTECDTEAYRYDPSLGLGGAGGFRDNVALPRSVGRLGAALLPDGRVLLAGGINEATATFLYDPLTGQMTADAPMTAPHTAHTMTVLPGGDVLVIGGDQATVDLRVAAAVAHPLAGTMSVAREEHRAVRLQDGHLLVAGGHDAAGTGTSHASADILDPFTGSFTPTGQMTTGREDFSMTLLPSGKVLVAGGRTDREVVASAEVYDPVARSFHAVGNMLGKRAHHTSFVRADGKAVLAGGCSGTAVRYCADNLLATAELFDPESETFDAAPSMLAARAQPGFVRLPDGRVMMAGGGTTEMYDEASGVFRAGVAPGAARDGKTAHLLLSGKMFLSGGNTRAAELYDASTNLWSFTPSLAYTNPDTVWTPMPDGRLLATGGRPFQGAESRVMVFDGRASDGATVVTPGTLATTLTSHVATLTPRGVIVTGGSNCQGGCVGKTSDGALLFHDGAADAVRPVVSKVPPSVVGGGTITLEGLRFADVTEGSTGDGSSSAGNGPVALWVAASGDAVLAGGRILDFSDTRATWVAPATALHGPGWLHVAVNGTLSHGVPLEITAASLATRCTSDAECGTGFCTDGVCCDRRCDGACDGCTAARKKSGVDGVCGAVPPGRDIKGLCFGRQGQACEDAFECATGFCVEGVCCDSSCQGQCLSCAQTGHAGSCTAIAEGACDVACDGDHLLKKVAAPDVDCAPYKCEGKQCRPTCSSARDCVAPFVCSFDQRCVAPVNAVPANETAYGCSVVAAEGGGHAGGLGWLGALGALGAGAAVSRRRRGP